MRLNNTLSRSIDDLRPIDGTTVKLYTCGLTVYSQPHIGNWLGYIYWDVLVRALRAEGYTVLRTQNITDVGHLVSDEDAGEDKMEKGARREGTTAWDVAEKYIAIADQEAKQLGLLPPDHLIRATALIDAQIDFARELDAKGYLYEIPGDGMYFDTARLSNYGRLARLDIEGLEAGARVSAEGKRNSTDFAVWKFSPAGAQRDMEWASPWGTGFPGWHLECSVIARETLGNQIDIHTGGIDHIPVHHTNEIAQTEAVTGAQFSQIWLHNNHLKADGTKISKSLGNIYTLADIVTRGYDLMAFRAFSLGKHFSTEGNFTWDNLEAAANRWWHWREAAALRWQIDAETGDDLDEFGSTVLAALSNNLDTPAALQLLDVATEQILTGKVSVQGVTQFIQIAAEYLGIDVSVSDISAGQKQLIADRQAARVKKDWAVSDKLRDELMAAGIGLRDVVDRTIWYRL